MTFKLWRFVVGMMVPIVFGGGILLRDSEEKLMTRVVYSEVATRSWLEREAVAKSILNRVESFDYPSDIRGVVYQDGAYSCIGSNNWRESKFPVFRNGFKEGVYRECGDAVRDVLGGKRLGIPREDEIVSFYSGGVKPKGGYWDSLVKVFGVEGGMSYCVSGD